MPGIKELEKLKFIVEIPEKYRFTKDSTGVWQVHFEKYFDAPVEAQAQQVLEMPIEEVSVLEGRLIGHGVSKSQARRFVSEFDDELIESQLEALEFLLVKGGNAAPSNRGGWLSKAISENYGPPKGFKSRSQLEHEAHERAETVRKREEQRRAKRAADDLLKADSNAREEANAKRTDAYLGSLKPEEREQVENEALKNNPFKMTRIGSAFRAAIIQEYILELLSKLESESETL